MSSPPLLLSPEGGVLYILLDPTRSYRIGLRGPTITIVQYIPILYREYIKDSTHCAFYYNIIVDSTSPSGAPLLGSTGAPLLRYIVNPTNSPSGASLLGSYYILLDPTSGVEQSNLVGPRSPIR